MKEGWEYRIFESCLVKVPKQVQVKSKDYKKEGNFPIVSQEAELISGYWDDETIVYKHKEPVVIFGDHTKNIKYVDFDFIVGADGTHILSTKKDISPKFFYYVLKSIKLRELGYARHYKLLKEKYIPVPPLSEQQSIVDYLDSAFAKIDAMKANAEKSLNEAKALFQASLKEMLEPKEGWEEKTLKEICRVINGRAYSKDEMLKQGKYRLLRVGNFFTNDSWFYSDLELEEDKYCDNGDLLYAWSASFGPRIWDGEKVIYHYHIWKIVCSEKIDKYFMYYWLDSDELKKQTMTNLHGATMAHITKGIIEAAFVRFPSLSKQQYIVATLDSLKSKVDCLKANYDKISQECDALKQAILRQVFE